MRWVDLAPFMENHTAALSFLSHSGLFCAPKTCPKGHEWVLYDPPEHARDHQPHFRCNFRLVKQEGCGKTRCGCSAPWAKYSPFTDDLPKVLPWQVIGLLFFFAHMRPVATVAFELSLDRHTVSAYYKLLRETVTTFMAEIDCGPVGAADRPVCVDETHITVKKRTRSGFTCVLAPPPNHECYYSFLGMVLCNQTLLSGRGTGVQEV